MSTNKNNLRAKGVMYTQQIEHSPYPTAQALFDYIMAELNPCRCAVIVHDMDVSERGTKAKEHYHAMIQFENSRSVANIAKILKEKERYVEKWDGRIDNGFSYLIHQTEGARHKHKYSSDTVIANFNYKELMKKITSEVKVAESRFSNNKLNSLLSLLQAGEITKLELEAQITAGELANWKRKIEIVEQKRKELKAEEWRSKMIEQGEPITVIWFYGKKGTGKSSLAQKYANAYAKDSPAKTVFTTGSTRDLFQGYDGSNVVVLDELRPENINHADLLKILDHYSYRTKAMFPARYSDKEVCANVFLVTSPFSPYDFWKEYGFTNSDSFGQLERRVTKAVLMTYDKILSGCELLIQGVVFNEELLNCQPNPYSVKNRPTPVPTKAIELFNEITNNIPSTQ